MLLKRAARLVGKRFALTDTGHTFKVLGLTQTGKAEVLDGCTRRYIDARMLLDALSLKAIKEIKL